MPNKQIEYRNKAGLKYLVEIPGDAPDSHASMGRVIGPPDLSGLGLPKAVELRLNNALYDRKLLTRKDIKPMALFAALQSAYRVDETTLMNLYKEGK